MNRLKTVFCVFCVHALFAVCVFFIRIQPTPHLSSDLPIMVSLEVQPNDEPALSDSTSDVKVVSEPTDLHLSKHPVQATPLTIDIKLTIEGDKPVDKRVDNWVDKQVDIGASHRNHAIPWPPSNCASKVRW